MLLRRRGDGGDGEPGGSLSRISGNTDETEGAEPMELEVLDPNDLAANAHEQARAATSALQCTAYCATSYHVTELLRPRWHADCFQRCSQ